VCVIEEEGFESTFLAFPYIVNVQGTVRCTGLDKNRFFSSFFGGLEFIGLAYAAPLKPSHQTPSSLATVSSERSHP
jgi:hypothetical protein